jgi:DNA-binding LacI/PurR family transcriptional regulator
VPEDIKVIGFDSMEFSQLAMPSLTTINPRNAALADAIVGMVESYLRNGRFSDSERIKTELIIGESA